jgi:hypothetical protein
VRLVAVSGFVRVSGRGMSAGSRRRASAASQGHLWGQLTLTIESLLPLTLSAIS